MPQLLDVVLPDGTIVEDVPEGVTQEELVSRLNASGIDTSWYTPKQSLAERNNQMLSQQLQQDVQAHPEPQQQEQPSRPFNLNAPVGTPKEQQQQENFLMSGLYQPSESDVVHAGKQAGVQMGLGLVAPLRMGASAFGANSAPAQKLGEVEQYLTGMLDAANIKDMETAQKIRKDAEDKGIWDQVVAEWEALKAEPQALPRLAVGAVPFMAAAIAAPEASLGVGVATGLGGTKEAIFDTVQSRVAQKLIDEGVDQDTAVKKATEIADKAQSYDGENVDQIVIGGLLGLVTAGKANEITGSVISGMAEKGLLRATAESAATLGTFNTQSRLAENIASQREGFDVPTFQGAPGAFAAGAIPGVALGLLHGAQPKVPDLFERYKESTGFNPEDYRAEPTLTPEEPRQLRGPTDESARTATRVEDYGVDDTGAGAGLPVPSEARPQEGPAGKTQVAPRGGMGVPGGDLGPTGGTEGREPGALEEPKIEETVPEVSTEESQLLKAYNDLVPQWEAARAAKDEATLAKLHPTIQKAKTALDSYYLTRTNKAFWKAEKERAQAKGVENERIYGEMPIGTKIGMIGYEHTDRLYWEKTGDNEWTRKGMGNEKITKTSAEMEGNRVVPAKETSLASISSESARNDVIRTLMDTEPTRNVPKTTLRTQVKEVNDAISGAIARGENIGTVINKGIQLQNTLAERTKEQRNKKLAYELAPERGEEIVREKLLAAVRRGEVTKEQYGLIDWALRQNPNLAKDLAISVRTARGNEIGSGGQYNPISATMDIFKRAGDKHTTVHEVLHHAERMLPEDQRDKNRAEWFSALKSLHDMAQDVGDQRIIDFVKNVVEANTAEGRTAQDAHEKLVEDFKTGKLKADELYHYIDPSEYWAVKGSKLIADKAAAGDSWAKRTMQWLREFLERIKKALGLDNNAAIVKGINEVLNKKKTKGTLSGEMLRSGELKEPSLSVQGPKKPKTPKQAKIDATERKIAISEDVFDKNVGVGDLLLEAKDFKDRLKVLNNALDAGNVAYIKAILPTMPTDQIIRWVGDKIPQLSEVGTLKMNMDSARLKRVVRNSEVLEKLVKFANETPEFRGLKQLAATMHSATLREVDPTLHSNVQQALLADEELVDLRLKLHDAKPDKVPSLKRQITMRENSIKKVYGEWNKLGLVKGGREVFKEVKDIYEQDHKDFVKLLIDIAENSGLAGDAKDPTSEKGKLMSAVRARFVESKKIPVYFPLSHIGKYWVRIGKGASGQTTMFNTATARNRYVSNYVEGSGKTKTELLRSEALDEGDDVRSLRTADKSITSDKLLTEIFELLDKNAQVSGQAVSTKVDVEEVKDAVFQLFFRSLPGGDIRSRYTKRKGKAGFSADIIQSFALLTNTAAAQLARLKYEGPIKRKLEEAYEHIKSEPSKLKLTPFIDEIAKKIDVELGGSKSLSAIEQGLVNFGSKLVFYSFLTKPKQFLVQLTQLPIVGYPTLMRDYGAKNATAISVRYMDLYHKLGVIENPDLIDPVTGKRISPIRPIGEAKLGIIKDIYLSNVSLGNSEYVNDRVLLKHTFNWADEQLNMFSSTNTADVSGRSTLPTKVTEGAISTGARNMLNFMGAAIHHGERFSREFMFMSAFELAFEDELQKRNIPDYKKYLKSNYIPLELRKALDELDQIEDAFDIEKSPTDRKAQSPLAQAIEKARFRATKTTNDALFNYSPYNKPRLMTGMGVIPALGTKLMMYPIAMSHMLGVNAFRTIPKYREWGKIEYKRQLKAAKEEGLNDADADTKAKAETEKEKEKLRKQRRDAATQLFMVEGMQFLFGGLKGSALVLAIFGVYDGLKHLFVNDDEIDPKEQDDVSNPLSLKMDTYDWFINYGIPEQFGTPEDQFADKPGVRNFLSRSLTEGVISEATGVNIGASTGFNTLFFVDGSKADRSQDSVKLWLFDHTFGAAAGAATGLTTAWNTGWEDGEWGRALEKTPWVFGTSAKAFRHAVEGEYTPKGEKMKDKDWFNVGRLIADTAGFGHTDLAEMQRQTQLYFKHKPEVDAASEKVFDAFNKAVIWKEKNKDKFDNPTTKDEATAEFKNMLKDAREQLGKYRKSPYGRLKPITSDAINLSVQERAESRKKIPMEQREFLGMPPKKPE